MATRTLSSVSEIIGWIALGVAFPITANFFLIVRDVFLPVFEDALAGKPLPPITNFFAAFPPQTTLIAAAVGVVISMGGIILRRYEFFRRFQVFFITIGWISVFFFFGATMTAFVMPFVTIVNGIGFQP